MKIQSTKYNLLQLENLDKDDLSQWGECKRLHGAPMDCASGSRWATIWPNNWAKPGHFEIENFYNICRIVSRDLDWSLCSLYFANYFARFDILGRTSRACSTVRFTVCIPEVRNRKQTESGLGGTQMNKVTLSMIAGQLWGFARCP